MRSTSISVIGSVQAFFPVCQSDLTGVENNTLFPLFLKPLSMFTVQSVCLLYIRVWSRFVNQLLHRVKALLVI